MTRNTLLTTKSLIAVAAGLMVCAGSAAGQGTGTRMKGLPGKVYFHGDNLGSRTQRATLVGFSRQQRARIRFTASGAGADRTVASCTADQRVERNGTAVYYCSVETVIPTGTWQGPGQSRYCTTDQYSVELAGHFTHDNGGIHRYDDPAVTCRSCKRDPDIQGCSEWLTRAECAERGKTTLCADR